MTTAELVRKLYRQGETILATRLIHLSQDGEIDEAMRELFALDIAIEYLEGLPLLNTAGELLQPLYALRDRVTPSLGSGFSAPSVYYLQAGAAGAVQALITSGIFKTQARKDIALLMTEGGKPISPETIRSWTKGKNMAVTKGAIDRAMAEILRHRPEDPLTMDERAKSWLRSLLARYRRP